MKKRGKHFVVKQRHPRLPERADGVGETREFSPPRHRPLSYFFFTLFLCLLLAVFAAAVLSVDYFGRAMSSGTELTFAFNVTEAGEAKLSLLGRDYSADLSFLAAAGERVKSAAAPVRQMLPKSVALLAEGIPALYREAAYLISQAGKALVGLVLS